jgi:hypothetical protein
MGWNSDAMNARDVRTLCHTLLDMTEFYFGFVHWSRRARAHVDECFDGMPGGLFYHLQAFHGERGLMDAGN